MNTLPRIYADFNKLDAPGRVILTCRGTKKDLDALGLAFHEGMRIRLYMPDDLDENGNLDSLEVDAVIEHDEKNKWWVGVYVHDDLDYVSKKNKRKK
jgi:hypothetical protein